MKRKIRRRCICGCGRITNYGKMYINEHHLFGNTHTLGYKHSKKSKRRMSFAKMGNTNMLRHKHTEETKKKMSLAHKGIKQSKERILNRSLLNIRYNPNYEYCDIWKDKEYRNDIRKDYCENIDCKNNYKYLGNHHIYLDKKRCAPNEVMTLCNPCHMVLHRKLQRGTNTSTNPKHFIIINRPGHVSYIHKESRKIIRIMKRKK